MKCRENLVLAKVTNKSTKRDPGVSYCSPPLFPTMANHCSLHYNLSQQEGLLRMGRKLRSTFFRSEVMSVIFTLFPGPFSSLGGRVGKADPWAFSRLVLKQGKRSRERSWCKVFDTFICIIPRVLITNAI